MPLPIRTAALLGTPSKTLLSGTPEFVRAEGNFVSHCRSWLERKFSLRTFYPTFSEMAKSSPRRLMRGQECRIKIQKH
ncbi:hypothetical protein V8E54_009348 [Elaphomyces granulatus]